jgi:hypothetical protein
MLTDEIFHVCHTTVTNTNCVAVEKFVQFVWGVKCLLIRFRNACATRGGSRIFRTLVKVFGCTI